jgi:transcriptional regulator with XRE-family HTH domain
MNRSATSTSHAHTVRRDGFANQMRTVGQLGTQERAALATAIQQTDMAELERAGIARRIRQARNEAGLSQPEMAEAIGVIARTYQNYESVKDPRVPWGLMNQIAAVTGKTTEWLIHGDQAAARAVQVDDGFDEFRQYVSDIRQDIQNVNGRLDDLARTVAMTFTMLELVLEELGASRVTERAVEHLQVPRLRQDLFAVFDEPDSEDPPRAAGNHG